MSLPVSRGSAAVTRIPHIPTRLSESSKIVFRRSAMDRRLPKTTPEMKPTSQIIGAKTIGSSPGSMLSGSMTPMIVPAVIVRADHRIPHVRPMPTTTRKLRIILFILPLLCFR